jgi:hypothetical protein
MPRAAELGVRFTMKKCGARNIAPAITAKTNRRQLSGRRDIEVAI